MRKIILFLFISLAGQQASRAQYDFTSVTQLLTDSLGVIGQAGQNLGFMIVEGDSVIYKEYFGSWDDNTYQPIASGSKLPSMALIMNLIDEGILSPAQVVQDILPSFNGKPEMTLHQLMSHTSGLPGNSSFIANNELSLQQAADSIGLVTPMTMFDPGTAFQYGGVSMHAAGRMAEVTSGLSWDALFQQRIGDPLGLTQTDYIGLGATTNYRIAGGMGTTMPEFARILVMLLQYGRYEDFQVIDSLTVMMMMEDQTGGLPLEGTPYANDPVRQDWRYGYGGWIEQELNGRTTQFGSQGAFGFTPWIDRCRNIACVFFTRRTLGIIQPTQTALRALVEEIIPVKLDAPEITLIGDQLQSNYPSGNQWFFNGNAIPGATAAVFTPNQNGVYSVRHISVEGCEVSSENFTFTGVGIGETAELPGLSIFPNPARTSIDVFCPDGYRIYTPEGRLIRQDDSFTTRINISDLPQGLYFLKASGLTAGFVIQD